MTHTAPEVSTSSLALTKQELIIEGIRDRKGKNITVVDLSDIESASTGCFIICEGTSSSQVASIADSVRDYVHRNGDMKPYNYDGYQNAQWIVIDYGDIFVHIFAPEQRAHYNLEELWSDARITDLPDED